MQKANTSRHSLPCPASDIEVEDLEHEICLYRPSTDEVLVLNRTAADIWRLLGSSSDADELITQLARAYDTDPGRIADDVHAAVDDLVAQGFAERGVPDGEAVAR
jgi:hypothetical protein